MQQPRACGHRPSPGPLRLRLPLGGFRKATEGSGRLHRGFCVNPCFHILLSSALVSTPKCLWYLEHRDPSFLHGGTGSQCYRSQATLRSGFHLALWGACWGSESCEHLHLFFALSSQTMEDSISSTMSEQRNCSGKLT